MSDTPPGRGAGFNPPNRFERFRLEEIPEDANDPYSDEESRQLATELYVDSSRSILAENDSPDVPFRYSVNPYRGCEHGCVYCVSGETRILMGDGTTKPLDAVRVGDAIYGTIRNGWLRHYARTQVLAHWAVRKPAYRVTLEDGTELVASGDHRFLTELGWKFVTGTGCGDGRRPHLTEKNELLGVGAFAAVPRKDRDYELGYLCGIIRGDGHLASYHYARPGRAHGEQHQFRLALADGEALDRAGDYLRHFGIETHAFAFQEASATRRPLHAIRTHARGHVERIRELVGRPADPSMAWCKGFLAGIFDAEGHYGGGILRISNTDASIIDQIARCLKRFLRSRSKP